MTTGPIRAVIAMMIPAVMPGSVVFAAEDPENGLRLVQPWCATCHVVSPNQREASADAPTFASIGRRPGFDADKFAFFLLDPHPKMPNTALTRREAMDPVAYIAKAGEQLRILSMMVTKEAEDRTTRLGLFHLGESYRQAADILAHGHAQFLRLKAPIRT